MMGWLLCCGLWMCLWFVARRCGVGAGRVRAEVQMDAPISRLGDIPSCKSPKIKHMARVRRRTSLYLQRQHTTWHYGAIC